LDRCWSELPVAWAVTGIQLDVLAEAPRANQNDFISAAVSAKNQEKKYWAIISKGMKLDLQKQHEKDSPRKPLRSTPFHPPTLNGSLSSASCSTPSSAKVHDRLQLTKHNQKHASK
jgi:hypothetical protein